MIYQNRYCDKYNIKLFFIVPEKKQHKKYSLFLCIFYIVALSSFKKTIFRHDAQNHLHHLWGLICIVFVVKIPKYTIIVITCNNIKNQ